MGIFSVKNEYPDFSLITVNFQSAVSLGRMLRSLPADFLAKGEVIIVNNDPNESALLSRMFAQESKVRIIEMRRNVGFAQACNQGAQQARSERLIFLNPDIVYAVGSLEAWLAVLDQYPLSIVAPLLLKNGKIEPWSSGGIIHPVRILLQNLFPVPVFWSWHDRKRLGWVSGAALALRKGDFQKLHGFDEAYFLYYEDADLCRRAQQRGIAIRQVRHVRLTHRGGMSHSCASQQKQAYFRSQDLYIRQYYGWAWAFLFRCLRRLHPAYWFDIC